MAPKGIMSKKPISLIHGIVKGPYWRGRRFIVEALVGQGETVVPFSFANEGEAQRFAEKHAPKGTKKGPPS